jgi:hypothetical protein
MNLFVVMKLIVIGTSRFHRIPINTIRNCNLCARQHSFHFCYLFLLFETILFVSLVHFGCVLLIYPTKFEIYCFVIDPCIAQQ